MRSSTYLVIVVTFGDHIDISGDHDGFGDHVDISGGFGDHDHISGDHDAIIISRYLPRHRGLMFSNDSAFTRGHNLNKSRHYEQFINTVTITTILLQWIPLNDLTL